MQSVYNIGASLLVLALLALPASRALASEVSGEFTKVVKKEYDISPNGTTELSNKYGRINVKVWDRNRVKVTVNIVVNAYSESDAQKVFDRIEINFSNSADYVKAETTIEPAKKGWFDWDDKKVDFQINYEVMLPATNNLTLENKYGDVYVAALDGQGDLSVKYGNLKAEGLGDDSKLYLGYGTGVLERARDLWTEVSYSRLRLKEVGDLELNSKYSKLFIEQAGDIRANSKYDTYEMGTVRDFTNSGKYDNIEITVAEKVEVNSKYTELNVRQLSQSLDLDLHYGGARIDRVTNGFSNIALEGNYSDFKVNLGSGCTYSMEAAATYAGISYPRDMTVEYEVEKGSSHQVKGHKGDEGGQIQARLNYGGLKVSNY